MEGVEGVEGKGNIGDGGTGGSGVFVKVCRSCGNTTWNDPTNGLPWCAVCIGTIRDERGNSVQPTIDLVEVPRVLKCVDCGKEVVVTPENIDQLAWVNPREGTYYCGCYGWD